MKELKFQSLIDEIQTEYEKKPEYTTWRTSSIDANTTGLLRLIYDYDSLNNYGKRVIDTAKFHTPKCSPIFPILGSSNYVNLCKIKEITNEHETERERYWISQGWIEHCNGKEYQPNETDSLMFIFWALLVIAVDQTNKEKHLSDICDFAQMLHVSDQEVKDLVELVKIVCGQSKYIVLNEKTHLEYSNDSNIEEKEAAIHMSIKSPRILNRFHFLIKHFTGVGGQTVQYGRENIYKIKELNTLGSRLKINNSEI